MGDLNRLIRELQHQLKITEDRYRFGGYSAQQLGAIQAFEIAIALAEQELNR